MTQPPRRPEDQLTAVLDNTFSNSQIDALYDIVVGGPKQQNTTMTEATFKNYFLPVLAGEVQDPERLRVYYQGAAGLNVGVNVVDAQGNFLFEVPPLYSTAHIKPMPDKKDIPTFGTVLDHVELMRHRSPVQARDMMRRGLYQRLLASHTKNFKPTANERKWIEIFERYGYSARLPMVPQPDTPHDASTTPTAAGGQSPAAAAPSQDNAIEFTGEF